MATSVVSTIWEISASGKGYTSMVALARTLLVQWNASSICSVEVKFPVLGLPKRSWKSEIISGDKPVVKLGHADQFLEAFEGNWMSKVANGGNLLRKWEGTVCINSVPKKVYVADTKLAFCWAMEQAMMSQTSEKLA